MKCFLVILSLIFFSIRANAQELPKNEKEKKVIKLIVSLPEIIAANKYVKRLSLNKRHLDTYIDSEPTLQDNNYLVRVCEFNGVLCSVHFYFYVNAKTYIIKYWDVANDKRIPLGLWRKELNKQCH